MCSHVCMPPPPMHADTFIQAYVDLAWHIHVCAQVGVCTHTHVEIVWFNQVKSLKSRVEATLKEEFCLWLAVLSLWGFQAICLWILDLPSWLFIMVDVFLLLLFLLLFFFLFVCLFWGVIFCSCFKAFPRPHADVKKVLVWWRLLFTCWWTRKGKADHSS